MLRNNHTSIDFESLYSDIELKKQSLSKQSKLAKLRSDKRLEEKHISLGLLSHQYRQKLHELETEDKNKWEPLRQSLLSNCEQLKEIAYANEYHKSLNSTSNAMHIDIQLGSSAEMQLQKVKKEYFAEKEKLLPEWMMRMERHQILQISVVEDEMRVIEERRKRSEMAFEKEKRVIQFMQNKRQELQMLKDSETMDVHARTEIRRELQSENRESFQNSKSNGMLVISNDNSNDCESILMNEKNEEIINDENNMNVDHKTFIIEEEKQEIVENAEEEQRISEIPLASQNNRKSSIEIDNNMNDIPIYKSINKETTVSGFDDNDFDF